MTSGRARYQQALADLERARHDATRAEMMVQIALNRTAEWALVTWAQPRAASVGNDGLALWCRGIQMTRNGGTPPAISARVTGLNAQQVDAVTSGDSASPDQNSLKSR